MLITVMWFALGFCLYLIALFVNRRYNFEPFVLPEAFHDEYSLNWVFECGLVVVIWPVILLPGLMMLSYALDSGVRRRSEDQCDCSECRERY